MILILTSPFMIWSCTLDASLKFLQLVTSTSIVNPNSLSCSCVSLVIGLTLSILGIGSAKNISLAVVGALDACILLSGSLLKKYPEISTYLNSSKSPSIVVVPFAA
jgi:hypothetical protein